MLPDTSNPAPREAEEHEAVPDQKTEITIDEYHALADAYFDTLIGKLEARQEEKGDIDVEYSVRHLRCNSTTPPFGDQLLIRIGWCTHSRLYEERHIYPK